MKNARTNPATTAAKRSTQAKQTKLSRKALSPAHIWPTEVTERFSESFLKKVSLESLYTVTCHFINTGLLDPSGKTANELINEIEHLIDKSPSSGEISIDHTFAILRRARLAKRSREMEWSCLFYALWFEHTINGFVAFLAEKRGMSDKDTELIIRGTAFAAKCSWLLRIFGTRPIHTTHVRAIMKLMDLRNSFVHYKWKSYNNDVERERIVVLGEIERSVKYLKHFERKYLGRVGKKTVMKLLKR